MVIGAEFDSYFIVITLFAGNHFDEAINFSGRMIALYLTRSVKQMIVCLKLCGMQITSTQETRTIISSDMRRFSLATDNCVMGRRSRLCSKTICKLSASEYCTKRLFSR